MVEGVEAVYAMEEYVPSPENRGEDQEEEVQVQVDV